MALNPARPLHEAWGQPKRRHLLAALKLRRAHGCFPYSMDIYGYVFHLCPYIYIHTYIFFKKKYVFFLQFFCSTWLICSSHGCFRSHGGSPKNHPASLGIPLYSQDSKKSWLWGVDLSRWRWGFPPGSQKDVENPMVSLWKDTKNRRFSYIYPLIIYIYYIYNICHIAMKKYGPFSSMTNTMIHMMIYPLLIILWLLSSGYLLHTRSYGTSPPLIVNHWTKWSMFHDSNDRG